MKHKTTTIKALNGFTCVVHSVRNSVGSFRPLVQSSLNLYTSVSTCSRTTQESKKAPGWFIQCSNFMYLFTQTYTKQDNDTLYSLCLGRVAAEQLGPLAICANTHTSLSYRSKYVCTGPKSHKHTTAERLVLLPVLRQMSWWSDWMTLGLHSIHHCVSELQLVGEGCALPQQHKVESGNKVWRNVRRLSMIESNIHSATTLRPPGGFNVWQG